MEAETATRVFELGWRPDIRNIVLTIHGSVVLLVDILPFDAKSLKATTIMRDFENGGNIYIK